MTTTEYDSLLDDRVMTLWTAPSGLRHVEGWFNETICGKYIYQWDFYALTSLRTIGRMSRKAQANRMCKNCAREYEDVTE